MDDDLPQKKQDVIHALIQQSLNPLSVLELETRIQMLQAEIQRTQAQLAQASHVKAHAESLFRKD